MVHDKNPNRKLRGQTGENIAAEYLKQAGLIIIARNYRCPKGEMDIIAREGKWYIFVEVRSKSSGIMGYGEESIDPRKARRLQSIASYYLLEQGLRQWPPLRIDIVAILFKPGAADPEIKWIQNALQ